MIRLLPYALELILVVFCLIDCVQAPDHRVRNLPKWAWIGMIILVPIIGCVAWLLTGRPTRETSDRPAPRPATPPAGMGQHERPRPKAPDDDPEFLRSLKQRNAEHEELLHKWEEDLKRREDELRKDDDKGPEEP
jgi:hypothetical protein